MIDSVFVKHPLLYEQLGYPYGIRFDALFKRFLLSKSKYSRVFIKTIRFLGNGLVTDINIKRWKHRRALFNPSFHKHVLNSFIEEFNNKGDLLSEKLRLLADGKTKVVMLEEFNHATLDAIATVY